jgi:hypothetical protein
LIGNHLKPGAFKLWVNCIQRAEPYDVRGAYGFEVSGRGHDGANGAQRVHRHHLHAVAAQVEFEKEAKVFETGFSPHFRLFKG